MTVGELIEKLKLFPLEMEVLIQDDDWEWRDEFVFKVDDDKLML